jgi:hypothetical protein
LENTKEITRIVEYKQREKRRENSKWRRKGNLQTKKKLKKTQTKKTTEL